MNKNLKYNLKLEYIDIKNNYEQKDNLIVTINELYVQKLEKEILKHPEQYFWFHKKWKKEIYDL